MELNLQGRSIVITGGSGALGLAIESRHPLGRFGTTDESPRNTSTSAVAQPVG